MALAGRVVVITGGTRGIGRALAAACVAEGAHVMVCARTPGVPQAGVIQIQADVAREGGAVITAALGRWGRVDVLVNNAAIAGGELTAVVATNVGGALACTRAVLAACPTARIVNVSSGIVAVARPAAAEYSASKHALEGLTKALACDFPAATICAVELGAHATGAVANREAPPPEAAVPALLAAIEAPGLHGRVVQAWRREWAVDPSGADLLAHPLGPSPLARAALAEYAQRGALEHYGPLPPLAKLLAAEHGVGLDSVILGAGAFEILERILRVVLRPGERLVAHTPSWPLFPKLCADLDVVTVPYRLLEGRVDHDLDAVLAAVDRSVRMVYLISPANPMGCALDAEPFARFLAALPAHVTVVIDEAYAEFITRDDAVRATALARRDPRIIAVRTFSKFYALAGLRIGYAITAPPIARQLEAQAPPFAVTAAAAHAACAALGDREHARATRALLAKRPDALASDAPFALATVPGTPRYFGGRYAMVPLWAVVNATT